MGIMDNMKDKAREMAEKHGDKIDQAIDKAGQMAKDKTGGQHDDKIDQAVERGRNATRDVGGGPER